MSPKLISQKENRDKDRLNDHLPPSKKRPSHASQERERDTSLGSRLEGKGSKEGRKNTPPKLNREKRKRTLIHPQMEMNQNPAQRQKGWGLVRKDPTYKNKHRRTILPKTNENSTEASSSNRINLEQRRLMTEGQDQRDLVRGKNYGRRTQSPATSRTLLKIRKGTRENFGK